MKVKAIWIDAENRCVSEVVLALGDDELTEARRLVGGRLGQGGRFDRANVLYVDDDGRLKKTTYGFALAGAQYDYFVGNGLIVGHDEEGTATSTTIDLAEVRRKVSWRDLGNVTHAVTPWRVTMLDGETLAHADVLFIAGELKAQGVWTCAEAERRGWIVTADLAVRAAVDAKLAEWKEGRP